MKSLLLFALVLFAAISAPAQTSGDASIKGVVVDQNGGAIPGVTVTVTRNGDAVAPAVVVTGMQGEFVVTDLVPGAYSIEATLDGFQALKRDVKLVTGQSLEVSFAIAPAFGETVEVVAEAAQTGEVAILE